MPLAVCLEMLLARSDSSLGTLCTSTTLSPVDQLGQVSRKSRVLVYLASDLVSQALSMLIHQRKWPLKMHEIK